MADRPTKQVRIAEDLAIKISDIADVTDENIADMLDPLIRDHVETTHEKLKSAIKAIRAARSKHQAAKAGA